RCFDVLTSIGKYSFPRDLPGAGEPGIDRQGVDAAFGERMGQQPGGAAGEKMTKRTVNLKQHWTIAAGLSFSPMGKEQRVDEETVAGSEPDQLLVRAGQRSVSGHAAASQTAHPTIALQCRKALCACRRSGGLRPERHGLHPGCRQSE